MTYPNKLSDVK